MYRYNAGERSGSYFVRPRTKASGSVLTRLLDSVMASMDRVRQRRHLAELDDRLLRDIGVSRAEVEGEITLPFWQAQR